MSLCDKYFYKNKKLKLNFGGHVAIQNNFFFQNIFIFEHGGSMDHGSGKRYESDKAEGHEDLYF